MRSNVCKIENGSADLELILKESEKVAVYNELDTKQTLRLRLLCEEIDGMLPNIVDEFDGKFWIDFEDGVCKVNVSIEFAEYSGEKKKELVSISKNKKNAASVGIVGKIRSAVEYLFIGEEARYAHAVSTGAYQMPFGYMDYSYVWSLEQYRSTVNKDESEDAWDELEKSVIASAADDVIVGVKGKRADIIIVKKFA